MRTDQLQLPSMPETSTISSAKRGSAERVGLHAWLPYYAGFSSAFVSDIIDEFGLTGDSLLLDPMNGSGTTTMVARRVGVPAIGIDANPAMTAVARAKDAVFADPPKAEALAQAVVDHLPSRIPKVAVSRGGGALVHSCCIRYAEGPGSGPFPGREREFRE